MAIVILTILVGIYMVPVFAQTSPAMEPPMECWPQDLCKGNWAQTANSIKSCGPYEKSYAKPLGYCYAKPASVNLQIPIGELKQSATLTQYIPAIYNYLVSIVSIIAIVMIMVGGLRYLTAGGNPSAISSAKETILGAVIGLFLTFGSYILLQTINPALVQLKMPDIKMVRSSPLEQTTMTNMAKGGECYTKRDKATCEASCLGCKCRPICETNLEAIVKYTEEIAATVLTLGSNPSGALSVAKALGKTGIKYTKALGKFAWKNKGTTILAGGATAIAGLWVASGSDPGERGMCYGSEKNSVFDWSVCEEDAECKEGSKCVNVSGVLQSGTSESGQSCSLFQLCSSGDAGRPCNKLNPYCKSGLTCMDTWLGGMGVCSDSNNRELFVKCDSNSQCKTGYCNPTSGSCGLTEGGTAQGLSCYGESAGCKISDWTGVCSSNYGVAFATGYSLSSVQTAVAIPPPSSFCSDKTNKCKNRLNWLLCNGKQSGEDKAGKCLKEPSYSCQNNNECLYTCESGKCVDWPPTECK